MAKKENGNGSTTSLVGVSFQYDLVGVSPLLMHFDNIEHQDHIKEVGRGEDSVAGDDRHPADTWKTYLYTDGEHIILPFNNLMAALGFIGGRIKMPKPHNSLKGLSQTGIMLNEPYIRFTINSEQIKIADIMAIDGTYTDQSKKVTAFGFHIDMRPVSVNGKRHIRTRPCFPHWKAQGTFTVQDEALTEPLLNKLFEMAGRMSGLGDWRPGCSGRQKKPGVFGRFTHTLVRL